MSESDNDLLKTKALRQYLHIGLSDKGCVRESNQDVFRVSYGINGDLFVLCDGMGGTELGAEAARKAADVITKIFTETWVDDPYELIADAFEKANREIYQLAQNKNKSAGTTAALVLLRDNRMYYAHVGDSRIYYLSGKRFFALTEDHSLVQSMVNKSIISPKEARTHSKRHIVTRALGSEKEVKPDISKEELRPENGDTVLICSDGLSDQMDDDSIEAIIKREIPVERRAQMLVDQAKEYGGSDNITVLLISFFNERSESKSERKNTGLKLPSFSNVSGKRLRLILTAAAVIVFFLFFPVKDAVLCRGENEKRQSLVYKTCVISKEQAIAKDPQTDSYGFVAGPEDCFVIYRDLFQIPEGRLMRYNNIHRRFFKAGELILIPKEKSE